MRLSVSELGGQAVVGGVEVELLQKRVLLGLLADEGAAEMFGQLAAERGFAAADGAFHNDVAVVCLHGLSLECFR